MPEAGVAGASVGVYAMCKEFKHKKRSKSSSSSSGD